MTERQPIRDVKLLEIADRRNQTIPNILKKNEVFMPRKEFVTQCLRLWSLWSVTRASELNGQDSLKEAIRKREAGETIIIVSNHVSDSDHTVRRIVFERNGFGQIADRTFLAAGLKMRERLHTNWPSYSENRVNIPTPMDNDKVKQGLENLGLYSPEEQEAIRNLGVNYKNLGLRALRETKRQYEQGLILGLYPESTRSRTGLLGQPRQETAMFIKHAKIGWILPIAIEGGELILPPENPPTVNRAQTRVIVGDMYPIEKILAFAPKGPDRDQIIVDVAMAGVARLLRPKYISASDRDKYTQLMDRFTAFKTTA